MYSILSKLFTGTREQAAQKILEIYHKNHFCVIDYLYFAQIGAQKLFDRERQNKEIESEPRSTAGEFFKDALLADYKHTDIHAVHAFYKQAVQAADILGLDGIALQIFYFIGYRKRIPNLNGTDFCPFALEYLHQQQKINILLYGTHPDLLKQTQHYLEKKGYIVSYAQDGYSNVDWKKMEESIDKQSINILLIARSHIDYPIQSLRTYANRDHLKKLGLIVFNQGGTFDFWVGKQKRAPHLMRILKLEWLRRVISDPQRNSKKIYYTLSFFKYIWYYLLLKKR